MLTHFFDLQIVRKERKSVHGPAEDSPKASAIAQQAKRFSALSVAAQGAASGDGNADKGRKVPAMRMRGASRWKAIIKKNMKPTSSQRGRRETRYVIFHPASFYTRLLAGEAHSLHCKQMGETY